MANIDSILSREKSNKSIIYLYACGEQWCAYEHSAYHFSELFQMGEIELTDGFIRLLISSQLEFLQAQAMHSVKITSVNDHEVILDCGKAFTGFEDWKEACIVLATGTRSGSVQ